MIAAKTLLMMTVKSMSKGPVTTNKLLHKIFVHVLKQNQINQKIKSSLYSPYYAEARKRAAGPITTA